MKNLKCALLSLITFYTFADDDIIQDNQPTIYADISKKAQQEAVKYDGLKLVGGLCYSMSSFAASVSNGFSESKKDLNNFMLSFGIDYSKTAQKKYILGVCFIADIWKGQKKSGSWADLNSDYNAFRGNNYVGYGSLNCDLKTASIIPEIAMKAGYLFKQLQSAAFFKVGAQRMEGTYYYQAGNFETCKVKAVSFIPFLGISGERRINKRLGVGMELNFSLNKTVKKQGDFTEHKIKLNRKNVRVLATYSLPNF